MREKFYSRMFGIVFFLLTASLILPSCSRYFANRKTNHLFSEYVQWYQNYFPVEASTHGLADFQGKMPNFSPDSVVVRVRQLRDFSRRLQEINQNVLAGEQKITYFVLKRQIEWKLFELNRWRRWKIDANFYLQKMQDAIYPFSILLSDSTEQYAAPLINRLQLLPELMVQLKKNIEEIPAGNQDASVNRAVGLEKWLGFELRSQLMKYFIKSDTTARLTDVVNDSLLKLIKYLDSKPGAKSGLTPFLKEDYLDYLRIISGDTISITDLKTKLLNNFRKVKAEMFRLAQENFELQNKLFANRDTLQLIRAFDDELKKEMLRRDQIENFIKKFDGYTRRFIPDIANLKMNANYPMPIKWEKLKGENPFQLIWRETIFTKPLAPIFFGRMSSVNGNRDLIEQLSILRRYNKPAFKMNYLTEMLPIHFSHWARMADKVPLAARIFPDEMLANSWPYFFASYLIERGFSGYDRGVKFMLLKKLASMNILSYGELNVYFNNWQENRLLQFLSENRVFAEEQISEFKFKLYSQPAHDLAILLGLERLQKIYLAQRLASDDRSHPSLFIEKIIDQGPVPISFIQKKLMTMKE